MCARLGLALALGVAWVTGAWFGWNVVLQVQFTTRSGVTFGPYGSMNHATSKTPFSITAPPGQAIVACQWYDGSGARRRPAGLLR